ncbi:MAG: hypothetical protein CMF23_10650 [Ignavibacteriae bacterium]|nr:hypothetical protein [Ignavibacteriota bacterium]
MENKKDPKICIVSTIHFYKNARVFYKCSVSLRKKYNDVNLIIPHESKTNFLEEGIKIVPIPLATTKTQRFIRNFLIVYKKIIKLKPDVIHFHVPELVLVMWLIKFKLGSKIIFDVHENIPLSFIDKEWIPKFVRVAMPKIYSFIEKKLTQNYDGVILAEPSYPKNYKTKVIELLNYPILPKEKSLIKKDFSNEINFVYVGNVTVLRGAFVFINIFNELSKKFSNITLTIVGNFAPIKLKSDLQKYIVANNLSDKVIVTGELPLIEVFNILENSHFGFALLKPIGNYLESLSTKIFDYMVKGVPYIVSDFLIYQKYTIDENTGVVSDFDDIQKSVNIISELLNNRSKLYIMSENGKRLVNSKWNWLKEEKKLYALYESILEN